MLVTRASENPIRDSSPYVRRWKGGGGDSKTIEFLTVTAAETSTDPQYAPLKEAWVTVMGGPANLIGEIVKVIDHSGCIFNIESMDGYTGWAYWAQYRTMDTDNPCETLTEFHWAALNRCCEPNQGTYRECIPPAGPSPSFLGPDDGGFAIVNLISELGI